MQAGLGLGLGVDVKAAGLVHADLGFSAYIPWGTIGIVYGEGHPTSFETHFDADVDLGIPIGFFFAGDTLHQSGTTGDRPCHGCFGVLPAVLSWVSFGPPVEIWDDTYSRWLWSGRPIGEESRRDHYESGIRWSRIHAFDIEAGVFVLLVGARAGFSPGEFLDFLLGWVGIDIAGDDRNLETTEEDYHGEES